MLHWERLSASNLLKFLVDKEERQILQWFITHKSKFLQELIVYRTLWSNLQRKLLPVAELKEVEARSDVLSNNEIMMKSFHDCWTALVYFEIYFLASKLANLLSIKVCYSWVQTIFL